MPPCRTYTAEAQYGDITKSISNHKSLDQDNTALMAVSIPEPDRSINWLIGTCLAVRKR